MFKSFVAVFCIAVLALSPSVAAQQPAPAPIKRTLLQKVDVPGSPNMEAVTGIAEIMPSVNIGRHTHPGVETGYVMDGTLRFSSRASRPSR
jgi:quercetin dioxygenase-like cupin family protein